MKPAAGDALVLEVMRQQDHLKMCVFPFREFASTVRQYHQVVFAANDVDVCCREIAGLLRPCAGGQTVDAQRSQQLRRHCQFLWEQVISKPVKEKLAGAVGTDLMLLLDEELVNIPWELLFDGTEFLCLRFNLGRLLRAACQASQPRLRSRPQPHQRLKMLVLADPTADLASSYQEGLAIKNMFGGSSQKLAIDLKSTHVDALFVKKHLREYDLVHFAGHCRYDPQQPQRTGWELADSRLTTDDILALGENDALPSLVFSNACQSAQVAKDVADLDYREKNYSLASAFLFSGVRHYLGTSRKVEDESGMAFARQFYQALAANASVGEAVRQARTALLRQQGQDSLCWSSYLLYGDPTFRFFGAGESAQPHRRAVLPAVVSLLRRYRMVALGAVIVTAVCLAAMLAAFPLLHPSAAWQLHLARSSAAAGKNAAAAQYCRQAVFLDQGYLEAYPLLAQSYERQGLRQQALQVYFDYALRATDAGKKKRVAFAYSMAGWIYQKEGSYSKAFEYFQKAVQISRQSRDRLQEALALRRLAVWHMDREENDRALELLTRSSEINRERQWLPEHRYNLACDYFDMGLVFANKEDNETARQFYRKSMHMFRRINKKDEMSDYYFNLGEIAVSEKDYQQALADYSRGLELDQAQQNLPSIAVDYQMIGALYAQMDNFEKAEEYYRKSEELCRSAGLKPELAESCYELGLLYADKGMKHKAREYLRTAQEIMRDKEFPLYSSVKSAIESLQ